MSNVKDLINAISNGNAIGTESAFNAAMAEKISSRLETMRAEVAQNMFNKSEAVAEESLSEDQVEEAMSHQAKTTMKHIPNASPALKKAAKDIKPGIAGYADRAAMLKAGGVKESQ